MQISKKKFYKSAKIITSILFLLILVYLSVVNVFSATFSSKNDTDVERIWKDVAIQSAENRLSQDMIVSFDISESENILIATENEMIHLMDSNGNLLSTFTFYMDGSYYVQWAENNIMLLAERGRFAIEFTSEGELIDIYTMDDSSAGSYLRNLREKKTITVNDNTYAVSKDMGFISAFLSGYSYTTLTKTDSTGNQLRLYDVSATQSRNSAIKWIVIFSFVALVVLIFVGSMVSYFKNRRR